MQSPRPIPHKAARRAELQAERTGAEIRSARAEHALSRAAVSRKAGVSADTERRVEEGDPSVQLDTLCAVGAAVGLDIVVQTYSGRGPSLRDSGQLRHAEWLREVAHPAWRTEFEVAAGDHGEAADVGLFGPVEIIVTEIDRLLLDFQRQYRRNKQKCDWIASRHQRPVRLMMLIEDTRRNRAAVAEHAAFIESVLPAGSREVLHSLRTGEPLGRNGLIWIRPRQPPGPCPRPYLRPYR